MSTRRRYWILTGVGRLRAALGLSQPEMAASLGCTSTHYCACERDNGGIGKKMALRALDRWRDEMAEAGVSLEHLLRGK